MAKQSGLHQIKGKVGEHSYYRQTGVSGGLIRSINQGMSARVKTGAEYANTRLNNQEFGAAADTASLLGKMVVPKFRPMILPFSQSKMSKEILRLARENSSSWGQRVVDGSQTAQLAAILTAQSKRDASEFLTLNFVRSAADAGSWGFDVSAEQATQMSELGIDQVLVRFSYIQLASGQWNPSAGEMSTGYINVVYSETIDGTITAGQTVSQDNDIDIETFIPAPNHSGHQLLVAVVMPVRTLNNVAHILQEYCSFMAVELPAFAG